MDSLVASTQVRFTEEKPTFMQFLTNVCAIVGGVFTVSVWALPELRQLLGQFFFEFRCPFAQQGLVDSTVYHGQKILKKKLEIGKLY